MDHREVHLAKSPSVAMIGMATVDYLYVLSTHPREDTENAAQRHTVAIGGPAGRSAIAAARLGGDVKMLAMCGSDVHGEILRSELARESLKETLFAQTQPSQHSCVIVAADTGTRTTIWLPQPTASREMLDSLDPTIGSVAVVLLDCTDPRLTEAAIASCRRHSVPVVIDTGSYKKSSEELLVGLEYIIAPQKFFRARNRDLTLDKAMEKAFYDFSPKLLAATGGERGGVYLDESGMHSWEPFPIAVEDSCGAGDTFHGAFAWAVAADAPTAVSFDIAAWVAAKKCAALGNVGLPSRPALDKFLRNSRLG